MAIVTGEVPIPVPSSLALSCLGVADGSLIPELLALPLPAEDGRGGTPFKMGALVGWGGTTDTDLICPVDIGGGTGVLAMLEEKMSEETAFGLCVVDRFVAELVWRVLNSGASRSSSPERISIHPFWSSSNKASGWNSKQSLTAFKCLSQAKYLDEVNEWYRRGRLQSSNAPSRSVMQSSWWPWTRDPRKGKAKTQKCILSTRSLLRKEWIVKVTFDSLLHFPSWKGAALTSYWILGSTIMHLQ